MYVPAPAITDRLTARYEQARADQGFLMNYVPLWGWIPEVEEAFRTARAQLDATTTLSPRERMVIVCATVATAGDSYCSLAWGKKLAAASDDATAAALIANDATPALTAREHVLAGWARRVVRDASSTSRGDVDELRAAGLTDREIVEATALVAFRVAFAMVNDALGVQPDRELAQATPRAVRDAVTFGRTPAE